MSPRTLEGRTALVTGASRGIGAAIAELFAAEGANVVVTARTTGATTGASALSGTIDETVERIRAAGGRAEAVAADISRPDERQRLKDAAEAAFGTIDILVNNAAVTWFAPVVGFSPRRVALMWEVQVVAAMHLAQMLAPAMAERGGGSILNVSSGAARHPRLPPDPARAVGGTVYGMCKAALERFTTGLAAELWASGVAVNALSPNRVVPTPGTLWHHLVRPDDPDQEVEPVEVMAAAALALCAAGSATAGTASTATAGTATAGTATAGGPSGMTGRIAYSQDLLAELGIPTPSPRPAATSSDPPGATR